MNTRFARGPVLVLALLSVLALIVSACTFQQQAETGLGGVYNPPTVGENLVYVSAVDGYLYALDKETGDLRWRQRPARDPEMELVSGPTLATVDGDPPRDVVVVGAEDGNLYAYDATASKEERRAVPLWPPFTTGGKIWSTPVVQDGVIYFGSHDQNVYAVSLQDGQEKWRFATDGAIVGRALLYKGLVLMGSFDRYLYAINAVDGTLAWKFKAKNWFAWASPVADDQTIFAPSMDGNVYALDEAGNLLWQYQMGSSIVATPVLLPEGLLVAGKEGRLALLDTTPAALTPEERASAFYALRDSVFKEVKAPLDASDGSVFVGTQGSVVGRFQVRAQQVQPVWCFDTEQDREVPCD